jgi:hypothetical protein
MHADKKSSFYKTNPMRPGERAGLRRPADRLPICPYMGTLVPVLYSVVKDRYGLYKDAANSYAAVCVLQNEPGG